MKMAGRSYRDKIDVRPPSRSFECLTYAVCVFSQDLNKYLAALPVHNDIPKVRGGRMRCLRVSSLFCCLHRLWFSFVCVCFPQVASAGMG